MGQKVHPRSVRQGVIYRSWGSNWIANSKEYSQFVLEDYKLRKFIKDKYKNAALSRVEIDRKAQKLIIRLITGRPGVLVGRGGQGLDTLRKELQAKTGRKDIQLDVLEVAKIDAESQLVAESIAQQLEKRIPYRRAIKQAMQRAMRAGILGIKIMVAGRLGGVEIARTEWSKEGRIPLHTFRADIDYGFTEAITMFGIIGVKVWIFRGEVMPGDVAIPNIKARGSADSSQGGQQQGLHGSGGRRPGGNRPPGGGNNQPGRGGANRGGGQGRRTGAGRPESPSPEQAS